MNGNSSNVNQSKGNRSNGGHSNGNHSNENNSNGNSSNVNRSNETPSNGNPSNEASHSPATPQRWMSLDQLKSEWLENLYEESESLFLRLQEECKKLQEAHKDHLVRWQILCTEQERDQQLRTETVRAFQKLQRAFQKFQTAYEKEKAQRLILEETQDEFHDSLQRPPRLGSGTAQNTVGDSRPFDFRLGRSPPEGLVQRTTPEQSPPLKPTLNPEAPVFSSILDETHAHDDDSMYQSSSSQEEGKEKKPATSKDSDADNSSTVASPPTPPPPSNPSQTTFRRPRMLSRLPRRLKSDPSLSMRAGRASAPE
ncbi:hypothetical protein EAE96_008581 [Botrytis aclada]|nr:hypothetical protein EAE96_008581 [Botrytis aclada]